MTCEILECNKESECAIIIKIPPLNSPLKPLSVVLSIEVCRACFHTLKPKDFISEAIKELVNKVAITEKPDFDKAYLVSVNLDNPNFLLLKNAQLH